MLDSAMSRDKSIPCLYRSIPYPCHVIVAVITGLSSAEAEVERIDDMEDEAARREEEGRGRTRKNSLLKRGWKSSLLRTPGRRRPKKTTKG